MFNPIRHLKELGHDVHVVAFGGKHEAGAAGALGRYCASVALVPLPVFWLVRGILGDPPATLAHYFSKKMRHTLEAVARNEKVHIVELESLHMAIYGTALS